MLVALQAQQANPLVVLAALVGVLAFGAMALANRIAVYQSFGATDDGVEPASKTNCPSCGTRLPDSRATCDHCGESLPASE